MLRRCAALGLRGTRLLCCQKQGVAGQSFRLGFAGFGGFVGEAVVVAFIGLMLDC